MLKNRSLIVRGLICSIIVSCIAIQSNVSLGDALPPLPQLEVVRKGALPEQPGENADSPGVKGISSDLQDFEGNNKFNVDDLFAQFSEDPQGGNEEVAKDDSNEVSKQVPVQAAMTNTGLLTKSEPDTNSAAPQKDGSQEMPVIETQATAALPLPDIPDVSEVDQSKIDATKLPQQIAKEKAIQNILDQSSKIKLSQEDQYKLTKQVEDHRTPLDPYNNIMESPTTRDKDLLSKEDSTVTNLTSNKEYQTQKARHTKRLKGANSVIQKTVGVPRQESIAELDIARNKTQYTQNTEDQNQSEIDSLQRTFVSNEAQLLLLPDDDVVLGKVTQAATIDIMDFDTYIVFFRKQYRTERDIIRHAKLVDFIDQYDEIFYSENQFDSAEAAARGKRAALSLATKAIRQNQFNDLKTLLNHYNILHLRSAGSNTMLHEAVLSDNYPAARLLLMRGIDMEAVNKIGYNAMQVAKILKNSDIIFLLSDAGL